MQRNIRLEEAWVSVSLFLIIKPQLSLEGAYCETNLSIQVWPQI